jgi:hypothetical protein
MNLFVHFYEKVKWNIVALILVWKIVTIIITLAAFYLLPFNTNTFEGNFLYPKDQKVTVASAFKTWDAQHYLYLSEVGYKQNQASNWFYPLYPLIVRFTNILLHSPLLSGLLVSNILSFAGLLLFYFFVLRKFNESIAFCSLVLFMAFPTAFYLNLIYTEGLFLFLLSGFFLAVEKKKYLLASIFALFLPMTRSVGIFIFIPFLFYILAQRGKGKKIEIPTFNKPLVFRFHPLFLWLLAPLVGFAINLLYIHLKTGDFFAEFSAQRYFIGGYSVSNLFNPYLFVKNVFGTPLVLHGFMNSLIDRIFFGLFLVMIPLAYKKLNKGLFYFYLVLGLVPLLGSFMGYLRYLLPAFFPLSIVIGVLIEKKKAFFIALLYCFLALQTVFIILQALNYWVS